MSKWQKVAELCEAIGCDDTLMDVQDSVIKSIECVGYAEHVGYRAWLFRYKGIFVILWDMGNCHWDFGSVATWWDYIKVRFRQIGRRFRKC